MSNEAQQLADDRHAAGAEPELGTGSSDERPDIPVPGGDEDRLTERCSTGREELTPHETADCAGARIAELYERDEDGGS